MNKVWLLAVAIATGVLWGKVQAQAVYKCSMDSYSQKPCSTRILRTYDAPLERPRDTRAGQVVAHRLPGESPVDLAVRKRRVHLSDTDRDECARLDKKIPFERERIVKSTSEDDVDDAQGSLSEAKKRFLQLHC